MLAAPTVSTTNLFDRVYSRGWWLEMSTLIRPRDIFLLDLETLSRTMAVRGRHFIGRETVPIAKIRGTEGRSSDFDSEFHPRRREDEERWRNVARGWIAGIALPPVELIRVGDVYFVRDGHHRISVARTFGQQEIDAIVTEWHVDGPLPWSRPLEPQLNRRRGPINWLHAIGSRLRLLRGDREDVPAESGWVTCDAC